MFPDSKTFRLKVMKSCDTTCKKINFGQIPLTQHMIDNKELITILEGGSEKIFTAKKGHSVNELSTILKMDWNRDST